MAVVTMSRQRGSMGSYIALEVAKKLGLRYLDREIIESVAEEAGVPAEMVESIEEHAGQLALVKRLLGARPKLPAVASASIREQESFERRVETLIERGGVSREAAVSRLESWGTPAYMPRADYLDLITSLILDYATKGQSMIVGRGAQMILRGRPGVLHVQVLASFETRVYNVIQREGVKWREAAHRVRKSDEQRAGYLRRFYNVDWLDCLLYDMVINTDHIPFDVAVNMIAQAAEALEVEAKAEA